MATTQHQCSSEHPNISVVQSEHASSEMLSQPDENSINHACSSQALPIEISVSNTELIVQSDQSTAPSNAQIPLNNSIYDPERILNNVYHLVYRQDYKLCHKSVKRCEICFRGFTEEDLLLVKTVGDRKYRKDG